MFLFTGSLDAVPVLAHAITDEPSAAVLSAAILSAADPQPVSEAGSDSQIFDSEDSRVSLKRAYAADVAEGRVNSDLFHSEDSLRTSSDLHPQREVSVYNLIPSP